MKRTLAFLLSSLLLLTAFTACGGDQSEGITTNHTTKAPAPAGTTTAPDNPPPEHVHGQGIEWTVDRKCHWKNCSCGETVKSGEHTLEDDICTVCGVELYEYEDSGFLYQYNEHDDQILMIEYGEDGEIVSTHISEYDYDQDGNKTAERAVYYAGEAVNENIQQTEEVTYDANGNWLTAITTYMKNGAVDCVEKETFTYDEEGNSLVDTLEHYNAEGELLYYNQLVWEGDEYTEIWYDAGGKPLDFSDKFNRETAAHLFGTWKAKVDLMNFISESNIELEETFYIDFLIIFSDNGTFTLEATVDEPKLRDFMYQFALEMVYASFEEEGMTRAEADAMFKGMMGMTIPQYVEEQLKGVELSDLLMGLPKKLTMVYYVEDGQLYASESWNVPPEPAPFTVEGNQFTISDGEISVVFTQVTQ